MRIEREVVGLDEFRSLGVGSIIEQNRAQDGLFRVEVRGQSGFQGQVGDRGHLKNECRANMVDRRLWTRLPKVEAEEI